jgi:two-component system cell cycle response regulator
VPRAALFAGLLAYAAHALTGVARDSPVLEDWLYDGLLAGAAALCLARGVLVRHERAAWLVLGAGLASWSAGVVDTTLNPSVLDAGFPSRADVLWLAFYPAAYVALVLLVRARVRHLRAALWLDGVVGALGLAALVAALAFPALVRDAGGDGSAALAELTYPVADVVLAGFVLWVGALTSWRPGRVLGLVGVALVAGAFVDVWSLWSSVSGHETSRLDFLWPASAVLLALAAWERPRAEQPVETTGRRALVVPVAFAASSLALLLAGRSRAIDPAAFDLAAATLGVVIARMAVSVTENVRLLAESRHEASSDPLTGLGNRRRLLADLDELLAARTPCALLAFDLDGFKGFNDTFGHPAGDALLARLAGRLRDAVGEDGVAYRLGGDEFCVVARVAPASLARAASDALTEHGRGFAITTSLGVAHLPREADDVSAALRLADERLYADKRSRAPRRLHVVSAAEAA